jgi:hypothetical protein
VNVPVPAASVTTIVPTVSRTAIKLTFLAHALASGSFFTRIADLQVGLGLEASTLGLTMLGAPVGAISMFLVSARIVEAVGTRTVLFYASRSWRSRCCRPPSRRRPSPCFWRLPPILASSP